jgi:hypothetical protein
MVSDWTIGFTDTASSLAPSSMQEWSSGAPIGVWVVFGHSSPSLLYRQLKLCLHDVGGSCCWCRPLPIQVNLVGLTLALEIGEFSLTLCKWCMRYLSHLYHHIAIKFIFLQSNYQRTRCFHYKTPAFVRVYTYELWIVETVNSNR